MLKNLDQVLELIDRGAVVYCSHSGGKDSQAMYAALLDVIPHNQLVVIHADLGEVEYEVQDHIRANIDHKLNVIRAIFADGSTKTLFGMIRRRFEKDPSRAPWPSSSIRFCTSDLKRDPLWKFIRNDAKKRGARIVINAMGLRAEESPSRAKRLAQGTLTVNKKNNNSAREAYDWAPLADWTRAQVFARIHQAGQKPFWTYAAGNDRLSCVFCIFGCTGDLRNGAIAKPDLAMKYLELERTTGFTMFRNKSLAQEIAGIPVVTAAA